MRKAVMCVIAAAVLPIAITIACKKEEEQPPAQQPYGQPTYGQPAPTYGAPPATTQPTAQPTVVQPAPAGTLSQPGAAALPCQTDQNCITAKCHTGVGKCVFPCQNDNDCIAPNKCIVGTGFCAPAMGGVGGASLK